MAQGSHLRGEGTNPTLSERVGRFKYVAGLLGVLALDGCAQVDAAPSPSPTVIVGTPSPESNPSSSPSPEVAKFTGEVNYDDFENWNEKDEVARLQACQTFFEKNPPASEVEWSNQSTGMDIVSRYNAMFLVVAKLNADTSNPKNRQVAQSIADCMTSKREENALGHSTFMTSLDINDGTFTDKYLPVVKPETVTRYSDGTSTSIDYENNTWISRAVQGVSTAIGHDAIVDQFEVNTVLPNFYMYQLVIAGPADQFKEEYFGDRPPVEVQ